MAAKINRTGKTYGDLTVLETILGSNSKTDTYLVKCNCCGNTMIIGIDALLKGLKCKNCRDKDRKSTYQDLIGKECNGIKVVSLAEDAIGRTGHRDIRYNCLCSCGKEFVAYRSSLLQGKVKSCGCRKHITEASKMLVDNAEAMQDYDFAKNKDIDVSMLTQGSNVVVWWKCSACGTEWQTSVYHYIQRIKPCPVCSTIDKGRTSFQEQAVAYYAKKYFPKVVIGDKKAIGKELDIYIPSIRAAIEYDGVRYHSDEKRVKNDEEKSEKCKRNGIRLIRIREYGLPEIRNSENIIRENNRGHATLDAAIRQCLEMLGVSEPNIDTQKDSKDIYRQYKDYKAERSMGGRHPELLKEWDYELNVGIDPLMVSSSSSEVVHWICSRCGHKWEAPINGRAKENAACPVCTTGKRRRDEKSNLATEHPEIAAMWSGKNKLSASEVAVKSNKKVFFKCRDCGKEFETKIEHVVYAVENGTTGCPVCNGRKVVPGINDLASRYPKVAAMYSNKNEKSALEVTAKTDKKAIFKCPDCGKEFKAQIGSVVDSVNNGFTGCYDCMMRRVNAISKPEWFYTRPMLAFAGENGIANPFFDVRNILGENSLLGLDFVDHIQRLIYEYNGKYPHADAAEKDRFKFEAVRKAGYKGIRVLEPGLEVLDPKYDIVMPEGFRDSGGRYNAEIMEEVGRKVIHLLEEIYGRKASPEIWALNNFKEFEIWYDANKKELEANARKKGPKGKTAAKMAA